MISLLITLIVIGAVLYLIGLLPIDATIKQIIYVIAVVFVLIWLLRNLSVIGLG